MQNVTALSMVYSKGLQTTAHGPNPAREDILSLIKNNTFTKNLLIW